MTEQKTDQIRKRLSKRSPGSRTLENMVFDQYSANRGENQAPQSDISPRYSPVRAGIAPTPETRAKPSIHKP